MKRIAKLLLWVWIALFLSVAAGADPATITRIAGETGLTFEVPGNFTQSVDPKDGEFQLDDNKGDFVAIVKGDTLKNTFDQTLLILNQASAGTLKKEGEPAYQEHDGIKGVMQTGSMEVKGVPLIWLVLVLEGPKAPLRFVAMGPKLRECEPLFTMLNSIKKNN